MLLCVYFRVGVRTYHASQKRDARYQEIHEKASWYILWTRYVAYKTTGKARFPLPELTARVDG